MRSCSTSISLTIELSKNPSTRDKTAFVRVLSNKKNLARRTSELTLNLGETFGISSFHFSNLERGLVLKHGICIGLVILNPTLAYVVEGGALNCSESYKCNTRRKKVVISHKGWSVAGEELSHIVCINQGQK